MNKILILLLLLIVVMFYIFYQKENFQSRESKDILNRYHDNDSQHKSLLHNVLNFFNAESLQQKKSKDSKPKF